MEDSLIFTKLNYWIFICLMMLGLWAMISKKNLIKKVMGMSIFQSAVILFYVSIGAKDPGSDIPIYPHDLIHPPHEEHHAEDYSEETSHHSEEYQINDANNHSHDITHKDGHHETHTDDALSEDESSQADDEHHYIADKVNPDEFNNPLPHVLMLTAIVVGVATLGVALSLVQRVYRIYGSIEEDEVLDSIAKESDGMTIEAGSKANPNNSGSHA